MQRALAEAEAAAARGEVPVGAVLIAADGSLLAADGNRSREMSDPTAHAEMLVLRTACRAVGEQRIVGASLYVTLEPCPMCAGAISLARIRRLYWGANDPKSGGVESGPRVFSHSTCHHVPELYGGLCEAAAASLLRAFFSERR
ncbi:MAG: nucleoside deaminase [Hyphomicrobiaceae bacterium]